MQLFFREQIDVVDNRRERRLDIVRHVCDQLRLETLTFHALIDCLGHSLVDFIQIFAVLSALPEHFRRVDFVRQVSLCHILTCLLQLIQLDEQQT